MAEKHGVEAVEDFSGDQKRIKLESMEEQVQQQSNIQQQQQISQGDPHNAPPSRVVHARAVPDGCTHQQMIAYMQKFGKIS